MGLLQVADADRKAFFSASKAVPVPTMSRVICKLAYPALWSLWTLLGLAPSLAQEMEPRRWAHLPTGQNFVSANYAHTDATIAADPVLRIQSGHAEIDSTFVGYIRTFTLFDKSARLELRQPWHDGHWSGLMNGQPFSVSRSGWGDATTRFAVNLIGAPPLEGEAYKDYRAKTEIETIVGAALGVQLPTGEYMTDKLINLGSNRFTYRPQLGVVHKRYAWSFEATGAVAFYSDNDSFFRGNKLTQDPLYTVEGHIVYTFRSGIWTALSAGFGLGGESAINNVDKNDERQDFGWAISAGLRVTDWLTAKATYLETRHQATVGNDLEIFTVGLTASW